VKTDKIWVLKNIHTCIIWQFVVFYQYSCEGTLMIVATVTETCKS